MTLDPTAAPATPDDEVVAAGPDDPARGNGRSPAWPLAGEHAEAGRGPAATHPDDLPVESSVWSIQALIGLIVAIACSLFVLMQMRPDLLLADTTPAGGDMGAHVWGPAYLRDHLLPQGRLTGWTPDWYAGFPAYHFYMVVPSLAIVLLNAGLTPLVGGPLGLAVMVAAVWWAARGGRFGRLVLTAAVIIALGVLHVPYGVAFKLVSVSGVVGIPLAAWAMGRLSRAQEPIPAFLALGATIFLFDTNFTIYGGNIASTLAGEFAFSISLCLTLLAIGMVMRGMDENRGRVAAAVVIALVALCHIIPLFFAIVALAVVTTLDQRVPRLWPVATGLALALVPVAMGPGNGVGLLVLSGVAVAVVFAALGVAEPAVRRRYWWLVTTGPVAALLSMFWLLPFYVREPFFNDMGWERLDDVASGLFTGPMRVALPIAAVGTLLAFAVRDRVGMLFATTGLIAAGMVANWGDGPLWNARLLPFFYLSVYLVAGVGLAVVVQVMAVTTTERTFRSDPRIVALSSGVALVLVLVGIGIPLRSLPFGTTAEDRSYTVFGITSAAKSFLPSWTAWNYSGYERKSSYREYWTVVTTMADIGREEGCGRAMWEYSPELDRYGTPMALMLLPHWTDGCIGSMEGLYFESSATTPFHFLNQSLLSKDPSRAQRDLPYQSFEIDTGVRELQVMGVRYYLALTDQAIAAARSHPDLTELAEAQPFVVFAVADSELVEPLEYEPVVASGLSEDQAGLEATRFDLGWESQAVAYFNDPAGYQAMPAEDGPEEWERVTTLRPDDGAPLDPVGVSDIATDRTGIRFEVDEVGVPVLVKTSYFPNWRVEGADGPWRIGPNLMVVVPTSTTVSLSYGWTVVDWLAWVVTALGLVGLVVLHRWDRRPMRPGVYPADLGPRSPLEVVSSVVESRRTGTRHVSGSLRRADGGPDGFRTTAAPGRHPVPPPVRPRVGVPAVEPDEEAEVLVTGEHRATGPGADPAAGIEAAGAMEAADPHGDADVDPYGDADVDPDVELDRPGDDPDHPAGAAGDDDGHHREEPTDAGHPGGDDDASVAAAAARGDDDAGGREQDRPERS